ncbi:amino acid/amide ABC transporter ATP-binding protein 1 (HAAT family) [Gemmobacter caeni]|jgi:branched-chain amino acid transport system ATP-binding protein|uniref:Amino acid/amide ABC transporter ATP-binding protein 1 (HAAT family) n=1 Tax=Gemmobacter caeni TaxID=589035 RepID=A0A2T6B1W1_9RHOB|nr:ABC transporter ATP-binding protein [Gemmobacter caeni]PTX50059.1 amino acid/amide ABC transporter ATP-binding protein 1 (HAAT family) [Gemmobacter caeni]TWJ01954.1 amino acid/amide ABC transporter ATP-binding protein 1 (HAAT family) [Gemmobacter caeni]
MASVILQAEGLKRHFGGLKAVDGVDLALNAGEIHALIGPNGAGKTTLVSLLSGRQVPDAGAIRFDGTDITRLPAHERVRRGIGYTFQITAIYAGLSVFDNLALAVQRGHTRDLSRAVTEAAARVGLEDLLPQIAGTLSYGHQRLLEIGMGLALHPRLLILDEPTQGFAAGEIEGFMALVRGLVPATTVLLIEHNMDVVMALAERITVLDQGRVLASGLPAEIRANRAVQDAYLGGSHAGD